MENFCQVVANRKSSGTLSAGKSGDYTLLDGSEEGDGEGEQRKVVKVLYVRG